MSLKPLFNLNITINNKLLKINLAKVRTILHLSLLLNKSKKTNVFIEIPRFCFHPRLPIAGNCRMCLVEIFKAPKLVVACTTRVQDGMVLFTNSILVKKARENLLEFFLANHPLDCPICDQGGECDLQNQLEVFGLDHTRYNENIKKVSKVINIGVISFQMTRCIHCTRCVRFLTNIANNYDLGVIARGNKMKISKYINIYLHNEFLSNIVDLCPVGFLTKITKMLPKKLSVYKFNTLVYFYCGALTTTNTAYKIRSWELYSKYTVDILDNIGADIRVDLKGTEIIRILPRINQEVNDHWITDLTRYALNGVKVQRILIPYYKNSNNKYIATTWSLILDIYFKYLWINTNILHKNMAISSITGNLTDAKTGTCLKYFSNYMGTSNMESRFYSNKNSNFDFIEDFSVNASNFNECNSLFLIGVNLRLEAPFYNLKLKKKKDFLLVTCGNCGIFKNTAHMQYYNLGITLTNLFKFFEGKSILTNILLQANPEPNLLFIVGSSSLQRKDCADLIKSIKFFINFSKFIGNVNVIQPNMGRITCNHLNIIPSARYLLNNNTLFDKNETLLFKTALKVTYNLSADDYILLYDKFLYNHFHIFIGHTFGTQFGNIDLLLPTPTFLEKESPYLNIENVLRVTKIVSMPNITANVLCDWQIFFLFIKKNYIEYKKYFQKKSHIFFKTFFFEKKLLQLEYFLNCSLFDIDYLFWVFFFFDFINQSTSMNFNFFEKYYLRQHLTGVQVNLYQNLITLYTKQSDKYLLFYYFNKYWRLSNVTNSFFLSKQIEPAVEKQLLKHSRFFLMKNQYINKVLANQYVIFDNKVYFDKFLLSSYPIISKYRGYYDDNIISKNTLDIQKIKQNLKLLSSNYNI